MPLMSDSFPDHYNDPAQFVWDDEKVGRILDILGLDSRRPDGLISLTMVDRKIVVERVRGDGGATTSNTIHITY